MYAFTTFFPEIRKSTDNMVIFQVRDEFGNDVPDQGTLVQYVRNRIRFIRNKLKCVRVFGWNLLRVLRASCLAAQTGAQETTS